MRLMSLLAIGLALGPAAGCRSEEKTESASAKAVERPERKADRSDPGRDPRGDVRGGRVTSRDGTLVAFDRTGTGPALILVSGALAHRGALAGSPLVGTLAEQFTVYTYDRRGRGESTDVQPYAVEREIEDLEALIRHAGGSAYLFGVSSGAALAMQTAARLGPDKVTKLALYEPPYGQESAAFAKQKQRVNELVKTGKPGDAAEFFLTAIGMPAKALDGMKRSPEWENVKKLDFTLVYDYEVLGSGAIPEDTARAIEVPTLVMNGGKSMGFMGPTADRLAALIPHSQRKTLEGQTHQVDADATVPVLTAFFAAAPPQ
jgi:pimeloyl-ACP methyl ester carboxylesterase